MSTADQNIASLGLTLPEAATPAANYVPYTISGKLVFISGQLPMQDGKPFLVGKLGKGVDIEQGKKTAEICALNILAHLKKACGGDLGKVKQCVRLGVFVNSAEDFTDHPKVANGASDLMVAVFGDKGKHSRFAVGVSQLPLGVAVEVDATFELE